MDPNAPDMEVPRRPAPSNARRRLLLSGGRNTGPAEDGTEAPSGIQRLLRQPTKTRTVSVPSITQKAPESPLSPSKIYPITLPRYTSMDPLDSDPGAPIAEEESSVVTFPGDDDDSLRSIEV